MMITEVFEDYIVMPNYVFCGVWVLDDHCGMLLVNIPYFGPPRESSVKSRRYTETISLVNYTEDKPVRIIEL